ncbi:MAG: Tol-Pal system protein TolB [Alphaproteobacteria bacterium]
MKFFVFTFLYILNVYSGIHVNITQGSIRPEPIIIPDFQDKPEQRSDFSFRIPQLVKEDLQSSGLFEIIAASENSGILSTSMCRDLGARFFVTGDITYRDNQLTVEFRLFNTLTSEVMLALSLRSPPDKWRKMAHMIADAIYSRITHESGYFNTDIIFVEEQGKRGVHQRRHLVRMSYDGTSTEILTDDKNLLLTPRYSPDGKKVVYLLYLSREAYVCVMDLKTKAREILRFGEMTYAPRFSPDSKQIVMSLIKNGKSAIYVYNINSKGQPLRLTEHRSIDTSPCFSPDGKYIVFTSDKDGTGKEQIYIMDSNGNNPKRISFEGGKYSQPVWSPKGDLIAFTKLVDGQFYIGVSSIDGSDERLIKTAYLVENPCWGPDGWHILYEEQADGRSGNYIYQVDFTGRNVRKIPTPSNASGSAWSPLLNN